MVDGLDGCGKDTHAANIRSILEKKGEKVVVVSHPSRRFVGRLSKRFLEGSGPIARLFATLFFTADVLVSVRWYNKQMEGTAVFVRYLLGTAYLPERLAPYGYQFFKRLLPSPDMAFFIDIEPEVAIRRISARGLKPEMFETEAKLEAVRAIARSLVRDNWITVDNSVDGREPFAKVEGIISERLALWKTL